MAVCVLKIRLRPETDATEFERFMVEEVFPAARTVAEGRRGLHAGNHLLLKGRRGRLPYLWIAEWTLSAGGESDDVFRVAMTSELRARFENLTTHESELYTVITRSTEDSIVTPNILAVPEESRDPQAWLGEETWLGGS